MNAMPTQQTSPIHMPPLTEAELEAEAIRELERLQRARDAKRSNYQPKRRRNTKRQ